MTGRRCRGEGGASLRLDRDWVGFQKLWSSELELQPPTEFLGEAAAGQSVMEFETALLDAGEDVFTVQKLAGHTDASTTARYDWPGKGAKRRAVKALVIPGLP